MIFRRPLSQSWLILSPLKTLAISHIFLVWRLFLLLLGLFLSQRKYICNLLTKTNMVKAKLVQSPMCPNLVPKLLDGTSLHCEGNILFPNMVKAISPHCWRTLISFSHSSRYFIHRQ